MRIDVFMCEFKFTHDLDIPAVAATQPRPKRAPELPPDLPTHYEALLHTVWAPSEGNT